MISTHPSASGSAYCGHEQHPAPRSNNKIPQQSHRTPHQREQHKHATTAGRPTSAKQARPGRPRKRAAAVFEHQPDKQQPSPLQFSVFRDTDEEALTEVSIASLLAAWEEGAATAAATDSSAAAASNALSIPQLADTTLPATELSIASLLAAWEEDAAAATATDTLAVPVSNVASAPGLADSTESQAQVQSAFVLHSLDMKRTPVKATCGQAAD